MQIVEWQKYTDDVGDYGGRAYLRDYPSDTEARAFSRLAERFWLGLTPGINHDVIEIPRTRNWQTARESVEHLVEATNRATNDPALLAAL